MKYTNSYIENKKKDGIKKIEEYIKKCDMCAAKDLLNEFDLEYNNFDDTPLEWLIINDRYDLFECIIGNFLLGMNYDYSYIFRCAILNNKLDIFRLTFNNVKFDTWWEYDVYDMLTLCIKHGRLEMFKILFNYSTETTNSVHVFKFCINQSIVYSNYGIFEYLIENFNCQKKYAHIMKVINFLVSFEKIEKN